MVDDFDLQWWYMSLLHMSACFAALTSHLDEPYEGPVCLHCNGETSREYGERWLGNDGSNLPPTSARAFQYRDGLYYTMVIVINRQETCK